EEADIEFEEQPPLIHVATEVEAENVEGFEFHEEDNIDFHTNPEHMNQVTLEGEEADIEFEEQPPLIHVATEVEAENVEGFEFHEEDNIDFHTNPEHMNQVTLEGEEADIEFEEQPPLIH
ncbi:hypothetical protein FRX31_005877, partial [Thalictrum thalictroides]